jgi:hypothetical protein
MGLMANIPAVEAAQALVFARAISIAFGDGIEIDSMRQAR